MTYKKLTEEKWVEIKQRFIEKGESYLSLEKEFKCRRGTISKRGERNGWMTLRKAYTKGSTNVVNNDFENDNTSFNDLIKLCKYILAKNIRNNTDDLQKISLAIKALKDLAIANEIVNPKKAIDLFEDEIPADLIKKYEIA